MKTGEFMELIQTFAPDKNQINIKICEILHSQKIVEFRIQVKIGQTQKKLDPDAPS